MKVKKIKELPVHSNGLGYDVVSCLVKKGRKYFVVSSTNTPFDGYETLVFPADKEGHILDFGEVAGGRGCSREEAISDLGKQ